MIIYPKNWQKDYSDYADYSISIGPIIEILLRCVIYNINVNHLAYSGGIDSTIMLVILRQIYSKVYTYTISSREDHPDIQFARIGSKYFGSTHHEFIVEPDDKETDRFKGDNAVRQFFEGVSKYTDKIICCDGIDEFMCGYYSHMSLSGITYKHYLNRLCPDHLEPLNRNSGDVKVHLPYLDESMINIYRTIPLSSKVSTDDRKLIVRDMAAHLNVPAEIMNRNKYGMCDAFLEKNK